MFPAIRVAFSSAAVVRVQYDNAGGHGISELGGRIEAALPAPAGGGPRIEIVEQVAQSPDSNCNDLGFYKSIDSRLPKRRDYDLDVFEQQVLKAFDEYPSDKLDDLFDMKMRVCQSIISVKGDNNYKLPHSV